MVKSTGIRKSSRQIKPERTIEDVSREAKMVISVQDIMEKVITILDAEIGKIKKKSKDTTVGIGATDIGNLQRCSKCAVDLSRELRELEKSQDYSDLSDEDVKKMFEDAEASLAKRS